MNELRNYNAYLNGMARGNQEKLFFLDKLNLQDFRMIIDFGCGGGDVLAAIKPLVNKTTVLVGVDSDSYMRDLTKSKVPSCFVYDSLYPGYVGPSTLVIFNSVLHEVEDYWFTLRKMLEGSGATVVVRDMRYLGPNEPVSKDHLAKLVTGAHTKTLGEFIATYGIATEKDLVHYLLKYAYVDNWKLELEEDYFSFDYDSLLSLGDLIYVHNYTLGFKKQRVLEDFGIELKCGTHTQLILRCDKI